MNRRPMLPLALLAPLLVCAPTPVSAQPSLSPRAEPAVRPVRTAREDVVHLLNRAAFGPTTALADEVQRTGLAAWIEEQLHPERIRDPEIESRLDLYPVLGLSTAELWEQYQPPQNGGDPEKPPQRVLRELGAARLTRAVHARAQLQEVMVDFWANHFSVYAPDGPNRWTIVDYELERIRPHALGRFEDLVLATAQGPAMLYYLDNYLSVAAGSRGPDSGINENYARELMELHTLGVDGGYTQDDVINVARALTGWSLTPPEQTGTIELRYVVRWHDTEPKTVLGLPIAPGQIEEGEEVVRLLATTPATADFVARELVRHFVADEPPEEIVASARSVFERSGGDIREVVRTILTAAEFYDPRYRYAKIKSPLELVASALRASGSEVEVGVAPERLVAALGQPLWAAPAPVGWKDDSEDLAGTSAMLDRFDAMDRIARGALPGVSLDPSVWEDPLRHRVGTDRLLHDVLGRPAGRATRIALRDAEVAGAPPALLGALALSSPEFQQQ